MQAYHDRRRVLIDIEPVALNMPDVYARIGAVYDGVVCSLLLTPTKGPTVGWTQFTFATDKRVVKLESGVAKSVLRLMETRSLVMKAKAMADKMDDAYEGEIAMYEKQLERIETQMEALGFPRRSYR